MKRKLTVSAIAALVIAIGITAYFLCKKTKETVVYVDGKGAKISSATEDGKTYISAKKMAEELGIGYKETDEKIVLQGKSQIEIDKKSGYVMLDGSLSGYDAKDVEGEIMISPYLAAEIFGGEAVKSKDDIHIVKASPVLFKLRDSGKEVEAVYSDSFFLGSPFEYNHALSKISLGGAVSAFSTKEADKYWGDNGDFDRDKNIIKFYEDLGFENIKTYNYDKALNDASDKTAFAIAEKDVRIENESFRLIAVSVRGGAYGSEWVSNFNLGDTNSHSGFASAANEVKAAIISHIGENKKNVKLWITGYSRGAAVANIVAADMEEYLRGRNIYAYTFATPKGTTDLNKHDEKYGYIYNVVSNNDLIPFIAPSEWGFGRFGKDVTFPAMSDYGDIKGIEEAKKINEVFKLITGGGEYNLIDIENSNQSEQVMATTQSIAKAVGSREEYYEGLQGIMMDFMRVSNMKIKNQNGNWQWADPKEGIKYLFKAQSEKILSDAKENGFLDSVEKVLGDAGKQIKAFGAICIKNGKDPYEVITKEIGVSNFISVASVFAPGFGASSTIAKAHYPESYVATLFGISNPDMLKIE